MGNWVIHSVGDVAFLEQILISVAMLTGTNDFTRAASISLVFALIVLGFQSVSKGAREIGFSQVFVGWLIFTMMFVPTTTVVLEDSYKGDVRVVANVPLGVGAAGGLISSIGYGLTNLFEQGYGYIAPYVTETYFAESLNLLNKLRDAAYDPKVMLAIGESLPPDADFRSSWDNYIRECTLTKIDLGKTTVDEIVAEPLPQALRFESELFGTRIFLGTSGGEDVTCTQGYTSLVEATNTAISNGNYLLSRALGQALGIETPENPATEDAVLKINDSLQALRFSQGGALDYIKAAVLMPIYEQAVSGKYQDMQDISSAIMINQAIQQRNTQWAAEHSMFMSVVRPMQTFFEGFVYAITPLIAVLIIMGNYGLSLAFKYLQTLFWIQLWLPLLSIINMYICTAAAGEMSMYDNSQMTSMYGMTGINDVLQNWIATGGMLAASVPVISFFVVSGSAYAMTGIAGRIGGGDHVNEKIATPDVSQPAPLMQQQASYTNNPLAGAMMTGSESLVADTKVGASLSKSAQSAHGNMVQDQQAFNKELGRSVSSLASRQQMLSSMSSLGRTVGSMGSQQSSMINNTADSIAKDYGLGNEQRDQVMGVLSLTASGAITGEAGAKMLNGIFNGGAKGQIGGSASADSTHSTAKKITGSDMTKLSESLGFDKKDTEQLTNQLAHRVSTDGGTKWISNLDDQAQKSLKESASRAISSNDSYQQISQMQQNLGAESTMSMRQVGGLLASSPLAKEALNDLNSFYNSGLASPQMQSSALSMENLYRSLGMGEREARNTARLEAMSNPENAAAGQPTMGLLAAANIISKATGKGGVMDADPHANAGLAKPGFNGAGLQGEVHGGVAPASQLALHDHWDQVGNSYGNINTAFKYLDEGSNALDGRQIVSGEHQNNLLQLGDKFGNDSSEFRSKLANPIAQRIMRGDTTAGMSEAAKFYGLNSNVYNALKGGIGDWVNAATNNINGGNLHGNLIDQVGASFQQRQDMIASRAQTDFGLDPVQAKYFSTLISGAGGLLGNNSNAMAAREALVNSYSDKSLGEAVANNINKAIDAGPQAGAYLSDIAGHNFVMRRNN